MTAFEDAPTQPMIEPPSIVLSPEYCPDVVLWDVSDRMPRHPKLQYARRTSSVHRMYVHQSAADGPSGVAGAIASAKYCVKHRGFPGMPYHIWLPTEPLLDSLGRRVVLRTQRQELRSYHTGDDKIGIANGQPNNDGMGVAFQGNHTKAPPSEHQIACFPAVAFWLLARTDTDMQRPIGWHAIAHLFGGKPKPSCPGKGILDWLIPWMESEDIPLPQGVVTQVV